MPELVIVTTGEKWVGYGFRSFSSAIEEMMSGAEREIVMTVYAISDTRVVEDVRKALERGVSVEIFVYLPDPSQRSGAIDEIFKLSREYRYLRIHTISDEVLHAKVLIVDGDRVLAGSANPTFGGMVKNYELGFLVKDGRIAQKVLTLLRRLK